MHHRTIELHFYWFAHKKPEDRHEGLRFLIYRGGCMDTVRWGAERGQFYWDSGDYIDDETHDIYWALLPNHI